jgi:heat shock protein HslJ
MKLFITTITTTLIAVLMSCANGKQATSTDTGKDAVVVADSLYGPKWYLTKVYQGSATTEVTARRAFIRFNREQGSAGGNGSCNTFGSTLKAEGYMISISDIFSTKMWCEGVQPIEDSFLKQLAKAKRFVIKGNTLFLYAGDNTENDTLLLEFSKGEAGA